MTPPDSPTPDPIVAALAADAEDEAAYGLLSVTFDEEEGEVIAAVTKSESQQRLS